MGLSYGIDGIKQKNWKVWLLPDGLVGVNPLSATLLLINGMIQAASYDAAKTSLESIFADSIHVGECRKDSISWTTENAESVDGNEIGEIVLGKNCSFTTELINATVDNINELANVIDGNRYMIILEELDGRTKRWIPPDPWAVSTDTHEIIALGRAGGSNLSISQAITGGDIPRITLAINDTVPSISDFRYRFEMPYDLEDYGT